jgi:2-polyprenyl-3-methyl-5-hydroxy-6-metoxy-1,4-benzoquinol methylase
MCDDPTDGHKIIGQRLNTSIGLRPKSKKGISVTVQRCRNCGLIYSNPQPIPFDIGDHYSIPPESYWHPGYFVVQEDYFKDQIDTFKKLRGFTPGMKALDIGAGIGKCMKSLERVGFDAYGFEPSKPFYDRAIEKMGISPLRLQLGAMETVDYEPATFDFITFGAVFEHLYNPSQCLQKAMGWLKKDGIMHIEVPFSRYLVAVIIDAYYRLRGTNYTTHISPMHSPFHLYEFHPRSFQANAERLGYDIIHTEYIVGEVMHFPRILHPLFKWIMKTTNRQVQLTVWLKRK